MGIANAILSSSSWNEITLGLFGMPMLSALFRTYNTPDTLFLSFSRLFRQRVMLFLFKEYNGRKEKKDKNKIS